LLKSEAVLQRIEHLFLLKGVEPLCVLNPRQLLNSKLGFQSPLWLSNTAISKLKLLANEKLELGSEFFLRDLLKAVNFDLFGVTSFNSFIRYISSETELFDLFLGFAPFKKELAKYLELELKVGKNAAIEFIDMVQTSSDITAVLHIISYNQAILLLKKIASENNISFSSPPLGVSASISGLPLINLYSEKSDLETKFIDILDELITNGEPEHTASEIQKLVIYPWPEFLRVLENAIRANPTYSSEPLITKLKNLESPASISLATNLKSISNLSSLNPIQQNADIKTVVEWSYKYFELTKVAFEAESLEYENELANSFSDWLISQKARVEKSKFDWRQVSESIKESLEDDHITVVFMVDALSQIHHKACEEILGKVENLSFQANLVFAPLPTITKIGKKSVLTGLLPNKTSGSDLELLTNKYGSEKLTSDNILIVQDWKRASANPLSKNTKLAVVYINELDDRLHKAPTFVKHTTDALNIIRTVRKTIEKWLNISHSFGKEISFYVTADHGVTSLNTSVANSFDGKAGERVVELTTKPTVVPDNFYYLPSYNETAGYIVPKLRASFEKQCALSHGGLTPEEVLIPFIKLSTVNFSNKQSHFDVESKTLECKTVADKQWKLLISMKINCDISDLYFKVKPPFSGQSNLAQASSSGVLTIPLVLTSKHSQEGRTEVNVGFRYKKNSQLIEENLEFIVDIPKPLLKQTESSKNFGAMFDV
jgi:hypothetical protein